LLDPNCLKSCI